MKENNTLEPAWKFKGTWIPYNMMDKRMVLLCAYNCVNQINKNFKGIHYWQYKFNVAISEKWKNIFKSNQERCAVDLEHYSTQIGHMEKRAKELGFDLPDDKDLIMDIIKAEFPDKKKVK
jgi:hypothetical protein